MIRGLCTFCSAPLPNFLHSPEPEQVNRGIHLGYLSKGSEFRIPLDHFGFHFAFYGVTGSGKTRGAMQLAIQAENNGMKLLILDVEGEWKNIIPFLDGKTEYYSTDRNLKINPYDLNDYGLVRALLKETIFKGIEVDYQDISPQMNYVLDKCIEKSDSIPELIDNVTSYEESNLPFKLTNLDRTKTALLVRLEPYRTNPALNEIFYTESSSIDLRKLSERNLIIDLHPLESKVAYQVELRLIYNAIAIAYLKEALQRGPTNIISNLFIADEAQLLAPKILKKIVVTDTWTTTEFATRLRKRGQSLAIISQSPSNIEEDIRKNCQNNFIFRLQDANDVEFIARSFGYNWYTALDYFTHELTSLKQREVLVKTPLVNEPFIITTPQLDCSPITDDALSKHIPSHKESVTELENQFINDIQQRPFISMVERRNSLGWDDRTYREIVGRLIAKGVVEKVRVKLGKGGPKVLYQSAGGVPSIKHQYYVHWIISQLTSKGLVCRANKAGPDVTIPSLKTAIQVELGKSDIYGNIKRALQEFQKVIVCSDSKRVIERVAKETKDERVKSTLVKEVPALFD
ncbi:MAG: ATP-binding protein [Thaumarchaeota archaeon]|nr:ATP-binding protein [Nitrososphaerota archaeon]